MEDLWRAVERARELRSRRVLSSAHERRLFALFKQATQGPHALSEEASSIPAFYETEAREKLYSLSSDYPVPPPPELHGRPSGVCLQKKHVVSM